MSQDEVGKLVSVHGAVIGKYERGDATPSIDVAKKIADAFEVSLDYLIGEGQNVTFDKKIIERIKNIQNLDDNTQSILFNLIDTYIQNFKTKQAFAQ